MTRSSPVSILIVEDQPSIRQMLALLFTSENYEVRTAAHGQDAYRMVKEWCPDVVLLDLMMPVMTGWEVLRAWKAEGLIPTLRVVVMTGMYDLESTCEELLSIGARACLAKPFDLQRVLDVTERLLTSP